MTTYYTTKHVCLLHNVVPQTVRNWAEEFARHLTLGANPGSGRNRHFTVEDMKVFALVSDMKSGGSSFDEIHLSLDNGQRGSAPAMPPDDVQVLALGEHQMELFKQVEELQLTVSRLKEERDNALALLEPVKNENTKLKIQLEVIQDRVRTLTEDLEKSRQEIKDLNREIGYVKGVMEYLERRYDSKDKP